MKAKTFQSDYIEYLVLKSVAVILLTGFVMLFANFADNFSLLIQFAVSAGVSYGMIELFLYFEHSNFSRIYKDTYYRVREAETKFRKEIRKANSSVEPLLFVFSQIILRFVNEYVAHSKAVRRQRIKPEQEVAEMVTQLNKYITICQKELLHHGLSNEVVERFIFSLQYETRIWTHAIHGIVYNKYLIVQARRKQIADAIMSLVQETFETYSAMVHYETLDTPSTADNPN